MADVMGKDFIRNRMFFHFVLVGFELEAGFG